MRLAIPGSILLFVPLMVGAQSDTCFGGNPDLFLQISWHQGVYWSRTEYLAGEFEDGYRALEARIGFQTAGKEPWHRYHDYPRYGLGVHYADLVLDPGDTIVGNPFSAFAFYSAPWIRTGRFSFNSDLSLGLSYTSRVHDPRTNPFNDVIASHLNLFFDFNLNFRYALTSRLGLHTGYGVTHYSNGRIHQPQKGVNNWGWNAGLSYHLTDPAPVVTGEPLPFGQADRITRECHKKDRGFQSREELQLFYGAGVVDYQRLGDSEGIHYLTSSFTADYAVTFNRRMAISVGTDVLYDGSLEQAIKGLEPEDVTTFQKFYFASHLGYHFLIDRVTILFNAGTYFLYHSYDRGAWFMRAGGRVRLTDHLHAQICIKTKGGVRADWIEWGAAYAFHMRGPSPH